MSVCVSERERERERERAEGGCVVTSSTVARLVKVVWRGSSSGSGEMMKHSVWMGVSPDGCVVFAASQPDSQPASQPHTHTAISTPVHPLSSPSTTRLKANASTG